ncbi:MAG: hypothetical protein ACREEM_50080 [Blastocatellia bacterium]
MLCLLADDPYATNCSDTVAANRRAPGAGFAPAVCGICGADAPMLVAEMAAVVCQCSRRVIYRWIEQGALHFTELADRSVLVCGRSLAARLEELEAANLHQLMPRSRHELRG